MKHFLSASAILAASTSIISAAGLDRSGRSVDFIFEEGNKIQLSAGYADPSVDGNDRAGLNPAETGSGNILDSFGVLAGAIRYELNDQLSIGLIIEEPFGVDVAYGPSSPLLAGTGATVDSSSATAFGRYKFNDTWSVHGGIVYQNLSASSVPLAGGGFGGLNGYTASFANDSAFGYVVGAAYEIPDIALRVALSYHSEIDHSLSTTETLAAAGPLSPRNSTTDVTTPEQIRLDFQSGVAEDTLVFGSVRFSHYSVTRVSPELLQLASGNPEASLTDLENAFDVELGVGRRFNDKWAGRVSVGWSESGEDSLVSPLSGTNGSVFLSVGASYQVTDAINLSGGVRYTQFRDAVANVAGNPLSDFENNDALSAGLRLQIGF